MTACTNIQVDAITKWLWTSFFNTSVIVKRVKTTFKVEPSPPQGSWYTLPHSLFSRYETGTYLLLSGVTAFLKVHRPQRQPLVTTVRLTLHQQNADWLQSHSLMCPLGGGDCISLPHPASRNCIILVLQKRLEVVWTQTVVITRIKVCIFTLLYQLAVVFFFVERRFLFYSGYIVYIRRSREIPSEISLPSGEVFRN